ALSGGGVRSATFCLGVLQALAQRNLLRQVDFVSTVSGGGFAASFVGRLFTRAPASVPDKCARVQDILKNIGSPEIEWLRLTAQYIAGGGRGVARVDVAIVLRNLVTVHVWLGVLFFAIFGGLRWVANRLPAGDPASTFGPGSLSPWWWLP